MAKSPIAIERDKYFESAEGKRSCDASTLGCLHNNVYLKNRLDCAFVAGWNACEKNQKDTPPGGKEAD